jgi:hypothetical protein
LPPLGLLALQVGVLADPMNGAMNEPLSPVVPFPARSASSYCTDQDGCASIGENVVALNAFSTTSYYVKLDGSLKPCSSSYSACNFSDVQEYTEQEATTTGAVAQPLIFSNSGDMTKAFRALMAGPGVNASAAYLLAETTRYRFSRIQFDLEPSCWAPNASACQWPTRADALNYVALINATAEALASVGADCSVAVGNYPQSQCTSPQYAQCTSVPDRTYSDQCEAGAWNVDVCNCCAYVHFYALRELCASQAAQIVNMDTYQSYPTNFSIFNASIEWYTSHGCSPQRLSLGLLSDQINASEDAVELLAAVSAADVAHVDIWANLWAQPKLMEAWREPLAGFVEGAPPPPPGTECRLGLPCWVLLSLLGAVLGLAALLLLGLGVRRLALKRRTERRRELSEVLIGSMENSEPILAGGGSSSNRNSALNRHSA